MDDGNVVYFVTGGVLAPPRPLPKSEDDHDKPLKVPCISIYLSIDRLIDRTLYLSISFYLSIYVSVLVYIYIYIYIYVCAYMYFVTGGVLAPPCPLPKSEEDPDRPLEVLYRSIDLYTYMNVYIEIDR